MLILALLYRDVTAGSGYLIDPPSRSSLWRVPEFSNIAPINYNDMSIDCGSGGAQWVHNQYLRIKIYIPTDFYIPIDFYRRNTTR